VKLTIKQGLAPSADEPEEKTDIEGMQLLFPAGYNYYSLGENNNNSAILAKLGTAFLPLA